MKALRVGDVEKAVAKHMVLTHHYSGRCPGIKYCYGLYEDDDVVGCVLYSIPASYTLCNGVCGPDYRKHVLELSRLVVTTATKNAASFLIGRSLSMLPDAIVVSYADCNEHVGHVGYVYQATNWLYTGQGNAEPTWLHPKTLTPISYTRRHIDTKAARYGLDVADLVKKKQVGKHRYVYFCGSRHFKVAARKSLRYRIREYPKGPTKRHSACVMETMKSGVS